MTMRMVCAAAVLAVAAMPVLAQQGKDSDDAAREHMRQMGQQMGQMPGQMMGGAGAMMHSPPGGEWKKVSELVQLPEFVPGLGVLYVKPATLPAGPFLAYDRQGNLVSTVYMIPLKDMIAKKKFDNLSVGPAKIDHVDMIYNAGHPGVAEPHYHVVLWNVSREDAEKIEAMK